MKVQPGSHPDTGVTGVIKGHIGRCKLIEIYRDI